jgi:hypothetical protein
MGTYLTEPSARIGACGADLRAGSMRGVPQADTSIKGKSTQPNLMGLFYGKGLQLP